jgi:hypothetical protein
MPNKFGHTKIEALRAVQRIIGYAFRNTDFLREAPGSGTMASGLPPARRLPQGNMRLAVYGDIMQKLIIIEDWIQDEVSTGE